jgi:hypothetical protein
MMKEDAKNRAFKFFMPLDITKGEDEKGLPKMKIAGIASTMDEDSDGEFLDPEGFDLDYFLRYGFLNWHHQAKDNPSAIVGEPTHAYVQDKKMYVEGELYQDSKLAKDIYELGTTLQNGSSKRRLGFSIEGKVLERDPTNSKIVNRAQITGCAITPTPKNSNTLAQIVKGRTDSMGEYEFEKSEANGGKCYLIDVTRPGGDRVTVDEDFNITIKSMSTANGSALMRESVDGSVKDLEKVGRKNKSNVTKGEVYGQIYQYLPETEISKAKDIYKIIETIHKNENPMGSISQEQIDKAFGILGINKADDSEDFDPKAMKKAEDTPEDYEDAGEDKDKETKEEAEKAHTSKADEIEEDDEEEAEKAMTCKSEGEYTKMAAMCKAYEDKIMKMKDCMKSYKGMMKSMSTEGETMGTAHETEGGTESPKDNKSERVAKGFGDELQREDPLATLIKAEMSKVGGKVDSLALIQKAMESNFQSLEERVSSVENVPVGKKSVTTQGFLKKGFEAQEASNGIRTLSTSINKSEILDILDSKAEITEKGVGNMAFANAMAIFESSGYIDQTTAHRLLVDDKIRVTN